MISIQPKWCELIASGKKTVEVRKTRPMIETPFKCYIYCTKAKEYFSLGGGLYATQDTLYRLPTGEVEFGDGFELMGNWSEQYDESNFLNGKVIGEFVCNYISSFKAMGEVQALWNETQNTCISHDEIIKYANGKRLYYWHISDLVIYDKPKELSEFATFCEGLKPYQCDKCEYSYTESNESIGTYHGCGCDNLKPLKRPPQSWCYVIE